jgi:hypothetical protein
MFVSPEPCATTPGRIEPAPVVDDAEAEPVVAILEQDPQAIRAGVRDGVAHRLEDAEVDGGLDLPVVAAEAVGRSSIGIGERCAWDASARSSPSASSRGG